MEKKPRRWWPVVKALFGLAILLAVGWRFTTDLSRPEVYAQPIRPLWLVFAAALYLLALAASGVYWRLLLVRLGVVPGFWPCLRAYFVSQLGKYVPGKAWAVFLRVGLVREQGVSASVGGLTTFVEVLTTMSAGVLLAAVLFTVVGPTGPSGRLLDSLWMLVLRDSTQEQRIDRWTLVVASVLLAGVTLGPVFPPVFNRVVDRLSIPFRSGPAPRLQLRWTLEGFALLTPAWFLLGLALWCAFQAIPGAELPFDMVTLARLTAGMGLSYVAGFVLFTPGGLGVREFLLGLLVAPELFGSTQGNAEAVQGKVVLAVLLLRVSWTLAEIGAAGLLFVCVPVVKPNVRLPDPIKGVNRSGNLDGHAL